MANCAEPEVNNLLTDYLIVGAGAMGLAFLEELIRSSTDMEAIIVDTRSAPGGHWNDAYDFVRLHQPAITYGLNSRSLGSGDPYDLASKPEILEHFELGLDALVATGRVRWFPQCRYTGDGCFESVVDSRVKYSVRVQRKVVMANLTSGNIPANTPPNYQVHEGVNLIPVNGLVRLNKAWERYMVIGAGKTAMDAIIFMLRRGVDPDRICWVISNDCWYFSREAFMKDKGGPGHFMKQLFDTVLEESTTSPDQCLFDCEKKGLLMRLDKGIVPTRYRAATVSTREMAELEKVKQKVRMGRVARIEEDKVVFHSEQEIPTNTQTLHIDCSAAGIAVEKGKKIFDKSTINIHWFMFPPPGYNAAVIAALELLHPEDDEKKNDICRPFNPPDVPLDFFPGFLHHMVNSGKVGDHDNFCIC